jgi:Ca2+-binding RTX toxin-like protein
MTTYSGGIGNDTLKGGAGNDLLTGGLGNDTYNFDLGTGNDTISDTGGLSDSLLLDDPNGLYTGLDIYRAGTNGVDLVIDFGSAGRVTVQNQFAAGGASRIETLGTPDKTYTIAASLAGTAGNDLILGTANADTINGGAGHDWIFAGVGNDTVYGGDGQNELHGGGGNDSLVAGSWGDDLYGGTGSDILVGGAGSDSAYYEDQTAGVFANFSGEDQAYNNRVVAANQVLETAGNSVDTLRSIESFHGSAYGDCLVLGRSDAPLSFTLGKGNDTVMGGAPNINGVWANVGYWDDPNGVVVNLSNRMVTATLNGTNYFVGRNSARDGWGNTDTFILDDGNLSVNGSDSADYIRGRDSNLVGEWFDGGRGNDTIDGGTGVDSVGYDRTGEDAGNMGVVVNLSATAYSGTVNGAAISMVAGTARDSWGNIDTLRNIENVTGSSFNDILVGSAVDNYFDGRVGNDAIYGGDGNDNINGGEGNDSLAGGNGRDWLSGGNGNDVFVFNTAPTVLANADILSDFAVGERIYLENAVMTGLVQTNNVALAATAFCAGAGVVAATTQAQRIIYNSTSGDLYYDQDGVGGLAAVKLAVIGAGTQHAALNTSNFLIV